MRWSLSRLAVSAAVLCTALATPALAQNTGTIRGRITESATQRPLAEAQIGVAGTQLGATTGPTGEFTLANVPAGTRSVTVRRIGFSPVTRSVEVPAGGTVQLDVALAASATQLDQVVVTGTAAPTSRRALGNAVTQLDAERLTQVSTVTSVTDLLQSKTPGVTLIPGSGTAGTSADIRIRGTSSLSVSNRPIFFIDGVRFFDGSAGNFGPSNAGVNGTFSQGVSPLDFINPEDIESIEVIKGPAAATLYGADAAGGVIQIITKKGARGSQGVQWNATYEQGATDLALDIPDNYTTCTQARIDERVATGVNAGQPAWPGCQTLSAGTVIRGNPLRDDPLALRSGGYTNTNLSARGGGERFGFFVSGDFNKDEGVFHNNFVERGAGRANFDYQVSDKLDLSVNASYTRIRQRLPLSDDAGGGILISAARGQPGSIANGGRGWRLNAPEISNEYNNRLEGDRYLTGVTVNYRPLTWFTNRFTTGLDFNSPLATIYYAPGSGDFPTGFLAQRTPQTRLFTFDYAGSVTNTLPWGDLTSTLTFGAQGTRVRTRTLFAQGSGFASPDFRLIQNATAVSATSAFSEQASLGYYVQEQIGFANRLFVTGALRADDNSAFGRDFDRVFYPKASLSYVISEEPALAPFFDRIRSDDVRFRVAYGQAGRAPGPYDAVRTFNTARVVNGDNSIVTGLITSAPGNLNLEAERGIEVEYGLDATFLGGRLGLEFTAYDKRTEDALVSLGNAPSTGFTGTRYINFGQISNSGIEIGLNGRPVEMENFIWESSATYSTNKNRLDRLTVDVDEVIVYNPYAPTTTPLQIIREEYPIGGFWGNDVLRNEDGSYQLSASGQLQYGPNEYVGPSLPTYEGAFSNTFTLFKNFRVYALLDFKGGNYTFNQRDRNRNQSTHRNSLRFNDPSNPLTALDSAYLSGPATRPWIQPADFVKLRDLSVSYTLPTALVGRAGAQNVTLTLAGHNLGFISKRYPGMDPEVNFAGQQNFFTYSSFAQFARTDSYTLPMTRRLTASVSVNF